MELPIFVTHTLDLRVCIRNANSRRITSNIQCFSDSVIHFLGPNAYDLYHRSYHAGGIRDAEEAGVDVSAGG